MISHARLSAAIPLALALASAATAQVPTLLADTNPTQLGDPVDSNPGGFVQLGGDLVFFATNDEHGDELRAMDLATGTVRLVADVLPGPTGSAPRNLTVCNGLLYFAADDGIHGRQLWVTDGTAAGTRLALAPGGPLASSPSNLLAHGSKLYFVADAGPAYGRELFASDGTALGTTVLDIAAGSASSAPDNLFAFGAHVYCQAATPALGRELWRSDGSAAGTTLVADTVPGAASGNPLLFVAAGNDFVFATASGLWRCDGTPAGTLAIEALPATSIANVAGTIYFASGSAVYSTDGSVGGAHLLGNFSVTWQPVSDLTALGSKLLFRGTYGVGFQRSWVSDGTPAGTIPLPATLTANHAVLGSQLVFEADFGSNSSQLWTTDGTVAGTVALAPVNEVHVPRDFQAIGSTGLVAFAADGPYGREPYLTDGTAAGTHLLADVTPESSYSQDSFLTYFHDAAGTLFFGAERHLWRSDGTTGNTRPVTPLSQPQPVVGDLGLVTAGAKVFFSGTEAATGSELWGSDGTTAGTFPVRDIAPGPASSYAQDLIPADDLVYFRANLWELWRTDGTPQGTFCVSNPTGYGTLGNRGPFGHGLVFAWNPWNLGQGEEPWFSDGTAAGTVPLGDFNPGAGGSSLGQLATLGDRCLFTLFGGNDLMATDGTPAGTHSLLAGMADPPQSIDKLTAIGDRAVFTGFTQANGNELWVTDGTPAGTHLLVELAPGTASIAAFLPTRLGDLLLFTGSVPYGTARRLWRTDGTAAGTFALTTDDATEIFATGDRFAWLNVNTANGGSELWRTDGTVAGTGPYADLWPGVESSYASHFAMTNGKLVFRARHPNFGMEPWVLDLGATHQAVGYGCSATLGAGPTLEGRDPVLGTTIALRLYDGPDPGLSLALLTNFTTATSPIGIGYCARFIEPGAAGFHFAVLQGGATTHPLAIPSTPALAGLLVRAQALVLGPGGLPEWELSNGVTLSLGQ